MEKAVSHSRTHYDTRRLVRMAVLVAIIFLLAFTPLGYLVIGPIAATTIQMPVIIGRGPHGADCRCDSGWLFWTGLRF